MLVVGPHDPEREAARERLLRDFVAHVVRRHGVGCGPTCPSCSLVERAEALLDDGGEELL